MQAIGDTTVYRTVFTSDVVLDTAAFSGNDTVYAGGGTDWVFASLRDD